MLPGDCIEQDNIADIISDLSLLQSLGVRVVLVHGARAQIETQLKFRKKESQFNKGIRITQQADMEDILRAIGAARFKLEACFSSGLPNSPMYGAKIRTRSGNFVTAKPQGIIDGIDYHYTGKVRNVDIDGICNLLNDNTLAIVSPLGYSITGEVFNLSFADVAISIATAIGADKLIAYNDDGAIYDRDGNQFRELTLLKCEKFLVAPEHQNQSNTYFALRACQRACDGGVPRAHVISANDDGALLRELYTRDGSGTMVYRDNYETIRRARIEDAVGILNLIKPLEEQGILVKRSRELLENEITYFTVMEKDNLVIGCAALYPLSSARSAELACVAINEEYRKDGRAAKLLTHIERQASKLKLEKLYALTTQTAHWFIEHGFIESGLEMLPVEKLELYNFQRNSKVFVKILK